MSRYSYGYYGFGNYVSVAEKRRTAEQMVSKLREKDRNIMPIAAFDGRLMATSFWGRSWCDNLESYADYENRLPRGRQYLRCGCVCDLRVSEGLVTALVNGSELYKVRITIDKLSPRRAEQLQELLQGRISSLLDMLQGKIPRDVKELVGDPDNGIIPFPKEIHMTCSCPDGARLCKHVAAVLYGIGRRLDSDPGVLFTLRGLDPELLCRPAQIDLTAEQSEESLDDSEDLSALFGIDLGDMEAEDTAAGPGEGVTAVPDSPATAQQAEGGENKAQTQSSKGNGARATRKTTSRVSSRGKKAGAGRRTAPAQGRISSMTSEQNVSGTVSTATKACTTQAQSGTAGTGKSVQAPFDAEHPTSEGLQRLCALSGRTNDEVSYLMRISKVTLRRWLAQEPGPLRLTAASLAKIVQFQKKLLKRLCES